MSVPGKILPTKVVALSVALVVCLAVAHPSSGTTSPTSEDTNPQPNVLFILTDDQETMYMDYMEGYDSAIADRGAEFGRMYPATPQCCPSRASFLTGLYPHNTGVFGNSGPDGGWRAFRENGMERRTLAVWLDDAGYNTAFVGKYLNGYDRTRYVPPGWDRWWGRLGGRGNGESDTGSFTINNNGREEEHSYTRENDTDYYSRKGESFIRAHKGSAAPWFLVLSTSAPHTPNNMAKRHEGEFSNRDMPRPPSFNEANVSDKPSRIRNLPRLGLREANRVEDRWRAKMEDQETLDDLVVDQVRALADTGQLDNTYIIYASDNGYALYRHRLPGKGSMYEESTRTPMAIRGPGIAPRKVNELVSNIDLAPTVADLTGTAAPVEVDGRSIRPLLEGEPVDWRTRLLIEIRSGFQYKAVFTDDGQRYAEHATGEYEYYDIDTDPQQLEAVKTKNEELSQDLSELANCSGQSCREADK